MDGTAREELVTHAIKALRECLPTETDLTTKNLNISIVGKGEKYTVYAGQDVSALIDLQDHPSQCVRLFNSWIDLTQTKKTLLPQLPWRLNYINISIESL